jgi:hypothetical protein
VEVVAEPKRVFIPQGVRGWSIEQLPFSVRLAGVLKNRGWRVLGDLHGAEIEQLLQTKNCGRGTIQELRLFVNRLQAGIVGNYPTIPAGEVEEPKRVVIPQGVRSWPIEQLPFSARLAGVLKKKGCRILGDLHATEVEQLLRTKNCGRRTIQELKLFINRLQAGEFDSAATIGEGFEVAQLLRFLDERIDAMAVRERGMLIMRFGGGVQEAATLEELGIKYDLTRERVRQILNKLFKHLNKSVWLSFGDQLNRIVNQCLASVRPLTPELLSQGVGQQASSCSFSIPFYIRLLSELAPQLPAWPVGQRAGQHTGRSAEISRISKEILGIELTPKPLPEIFQQLKKDKRLPSLNPGEFLEALRRDDSLKVFFHAPDLHTVQLVSPRTRDWVRHILSQAESALTPEEIIERAQMLLGDRFSAPSPLTIANVLKPEDGFYLLDRRSFGLRLHFRLPVPLWPVVRSDFERLLESQDRPVSTSEVLNEKTFDWTKLTNAYEVAQVLREDKRFIDLGRFLFALTEWGIEEREYVNDLIPKVLTRVGHPMTSGEISKELQRFRSITATSMASTLRKSSTVRDYGFGYYGLKCWGGESKAFLVSDARLVNRIIRRSEPPLTFRRLCQILEIPPEDSLATPLWRTIESLQKVGREPDVQNAKTLLSHRSWSYAVLALANRALPPYEIQWELTDRYGSSFNEKSLAEIETSLDRGTIFVRNSSGEYLLDKHLEGYLPEFASVRQSCFEILSNCNEIVGCDDLLERMGVEGIDVEKLSPSMLASLLRGDETLEEVGNRRFRIRR